MNSTEIRAYIERNIESLKARQNIKGMTDERLSAEISGWVCGACKAFKEMGALTKTEAIDIVVDLLPVDWLGK